MGKHARAVAERKHASISVPVETRFKRKRLGLLVVKLGALLGSKSLAVRGLNMIVVEFRVANGAWRRVPTEEVLRVTTASTR